MYKSYIVILLLLVGPVISAQTEVASATPKESISPVQFGLEHLTDYLGLKPDDISFRAD